MLGYIVRLPVPYPQLALYNQSRCPPPPSLDLSKVTKAVIPVAGFGTRFLPATKATPKEMFPVVDKPLAQYAVEEAAAAGIEEIIFITGQAKRAIEDHFDSNFELEYTLEQKGKT